MGRIVQTVLLIGMVLKISLGQGCNRVFARSTIRSVEEKSTLEIAGAAIEEICLGTCVNSDFTVPEICPLIAESVEQSSKSGFALIPTYEMTTIASQPEKQGLFRIDIIFDYNTFSGDVFLDTYNYTLIAQQIQDIVALEEGIVQIGAETPQLEELLAQIDLIELQIVRDLDEENDTYIDGFEPEIEELL